ncbi:GntR family transcriptional regulator [Streptomyces varsoviensis]|uniref:GntR family transcriptional regulator n=1 Tax=Streptomyces varsoviensis TaxID=67373 RepID=UPI00340FF11F
MKQGRTETAPSWLRTGIPAQATSTMPAQPAPTVPAQPGPTTRGDRPYAEPAYDRPYVEPAYGCPAAAPAPPAAPPSAARKMPRRHSVRGQILDALRSALVGGELVPGEVYSGPALGERFGVSATPVREAMQQLVQEGAVEVVPNRGFRVARRSARDLAELAEIRALLEVPAMLRLARTGQGVDWAALRPLADATATAAARGDRAGYAEADRAFHRALLALTGNHQLVLITDDLHRRSQAPAPHTPSARPADLMADAADHLALLEALAAQDFATVETLVTEHCTGTAG